MFRVERDHETKSSVAATFTVASGTIPERRYKTCGYQAVDGGVLRVVISPDYDRTMIRQKCHRLPGERYRGHVAASFTACMKGRAAFFTSQERCRPFAGMLIESAKQFDCEVVAYVFMPDHCHILLLGTADNADVLGAMKSFKHRTGYWLSTHEPGVKWQKDFYDHILTADEDLQRHVRYILGNPIRKGMVKDWKEYPFKGSTIHDLTTW